METQLKEQFVSELNQPIKGVSLWVDAWRRLKKNKMAMIGLVLVIIYAILSLSAPILPIHSYKYQVLDHQYLPPSLFKTAGQLLLEKEEHLLLAMARKTGRDELDSGEREKLARLRQRIETGVETEIREAFEFAEQSPFPEYEDLYKDIFKES